MVAAIPALPLVGLTLEILGKGFLPHPERTVDKRTIANMREMPTSAHLFLALMFETSLLSRLSMSFPLRVAAAIRFSPHDIRSLQRFGGQLSQCAKGSSRE